MGIILEKLMNTRKQTITNIINIISFFLALFGFVSLILFGRLFDQWPWRMISFMIFGTSMVLLYLSSAIYHAVPKSSIYKKIIQKIDHSMIYLMIAGGYTPICLLVLNGSWGKGLLITAWLMAFSGIILKFIKNPLPAWFNVGLYLFMGWLLLMAYPYLLADLGLRGFLWLVATGVFFSIGTAVLIFRPLIKKSLPLSLVDIFHVFVVLGTFSHLVLLIKFV